MSVELQHVIVRAFDPLDMVKQILEFGKRGATLKHGTYVYLKGFPLICELLVPVTEETLVEDTPIVTAKPVAFALTKEQLEEMSYEDLLEAAKEKGITKRKKVEIIAEYLSLADEG